MAQDLGFHYLTANCKASFKNVIPDFVNPQLGNIPIIFEVFTNTDDEVESLRLLQNTLVDNHFVAKQKLKSSMRSIIGSQTISTIKKILK